MRNLLIAFAALALLGLTAPAASAKNLYVSTNFGWNVDGDSTLPFVDEESGMVGTAAIGTEVDGVDGLRFELEAGFRSHDSNVFGFLTLEHDTTTVMANAAYDFNSVGLGRFVPFLLAGAGVAHTELTFGGLAPLTIENDGFAWQLGGGVNYQISPSVKAGVRYNYLEAPEIEVFGFELDGGSNHSVMAGVTVSLN